VEDPLVTLLQADLRKIRRLPGDIDAVKLADASDLIDQLGNGSIDQALGQLSYIRERNDDGPDGDVRAYFFTAGFGVGGETLDWRLKRYAADRVVDERTGLRRSDRGIIKISRIIRDGLDYGRPYAHLFGVQNGTYFHTDITFQVLDKSIGRRPHIHINGERIMDFNFGFQEIEPGSPFSKASATLPGTTLDVTVKDGEPLIAVEVIWLTQVAPIWRLSTHFVDDRLTSHLEVYRDGSAEMEVSWFESFARASDAPLRKVTPNPKPRNSSRDAAAGNGESETDSGAPGERDIT
jgi:hypothetical protein